MKEIEAKILEVNGLKIEETLNKLGAKKIFDGDVKTLFFDSRERKITKAKNVLRLRTNKNRVELTFKKVSVTEAAKVSEEYSVEISNLETMKKILENLGLFVIEKMLKHRISYKLDQAHFDIDHYYGDYNFIPEFLEIEATNTNSLHKYARLLGYEAKDCLPWSTVELIHHYSFKKDKS